MRQNSLFRVVLAALLLLAVAAPLASARADGTLDRILRDKTVRIGWSSYEPLEWRDARTDQLSGYLVDAARAIFAAIHVVPEFKEVNYATLVASIQSGDIDLSIADAFITIQRASAVAYTQPIGFNGEAILVRSDDTRFKTIADLNKPGVRIASLLGGSGQDFIRNTLPNATPIAIDTANKAGPFMEVAAGRADAGMNDIWAARRYVAAQPGLKLLTDKPIDVRPTAWIVKQGNTDLLNFLNTALTLLQTSGRLRAMAAKYPPSGHYLPDYSFSPVP